MTRRMRLAWYGATVFLSSAQLLVLEIVAGRLIAPYVGVSLYTWTSIIGVILAGLSLGNWLGGRWADRGGDEAAAGITLAFSGLSSLGILLVLTMVAPVSQDSGLSLLGASFLFVLSLFFLPAVLLGVVTPLLTTLALALDSRAGHVVGRMHALAALGSILGTFAAGYWLIQSFGTRSVVVGSGIALLLLSAPFFRGCRRRRVPVAILVATVAVSALTGARNGFLEPCDRESRYYCLRVVDVSADVHLFGRAHGLVLNPPAAAQAAPGRGRPPSLGAIHRGMFVLTDEPLDAPPKRLRRALHTRGVSENEFLVLRHGETLHLPERPQTRSQP